MVQEIALVSLFVKHFLCDYPLQTPYQFENKGIYLHPGGQIHALTHGIGTLLVCAIFTLPMFLSFIDFILHYHIDWGKCYMNNRFHWDNVNTKAFWNIFGIDQLLHHLCYVGYIWYSYNI